MAGNGLVLTGTAKRGIAIKKTDTTKITTTTTTLLTTTTTTLIVTTTTTKMTTTTAIQAATKTKSDPRSHTRTSLRRRNHLKSIINTKTRSSVLNGKIIKNRENQERKIPRKKVRLKVGLRWVIGCGWRSFKRLPQILIF